MIKDLWYLVAGDVEKTIVPAPYKEWIDSCLDSVAEECGRHLQCSSKHWNKFDLTKYPLDMEFGFIDEVGDYGEYEATIEAEYEDDTTAAYLYASDCMKKGTMELVEKFKERADEVGLTWSPSLGLYVDSFYLDMLPSDDFFGQSVYLSDGVYIDPSYYGVEEIEQVILEREAMDKEES